MKKNNKLTQIGKAFATVLVMGFSANSYAQSTDGADASATIITPISITKDVDMEFGNIAVQAGTGGTVEMTPAGVRTKTAGVTLPATTGTISSASFTVTGEAGYGYAITLPSSAVTLSDGVVSNMTLTSFTSSPSSTGTLTGGTETLTVGATLNVAAGQTPGTYTTATPFDVTVNYN